MPRRDNETLGRHKRPRQRGDDIPFGKVPSRQSDVVADDVEESQRSNVVCSPPVADAATAIRSEFNRRYEATRIVDCDVASLLKRREMSSRKLNELSWKEVPPEQVIRLNVGDEMFVVPLQLLLSKDENANYFDVLLGFREGSECNCEDNTNTTTNNNNNNNHFMQPALLDETGALFIDRDPATFRLILNYLRGYRMLGTLDEDKLSMLKTDARYFNIRSLMDELGDQTTENTVAFCSGPGVNPERNRFRVIYSVAMVGNRFLISGRHRITFQVLNSDYVGIGLVSDSCISTDQEFHKTLHCCVYYMTGVFYSNFPHHRKEDGLQPLEKDDYVSLMIDMKKRVAEYTLKNSTKIISLGKARKLRFAVAMKLSSSVRIVPEEEARELPLFQRKPQTRELAEGQEDALEGGRDVLSQVSNPGGAWALATSGLQEPSLMQRTRRMAPFFFARGLDGNARANINEGLERSAQAIVFGSFRTGDLSGDGNDIEPLLFLPGGREPRGGDT